MKKIITCVIVLITHITILSAQSFHVEKSPGFGELGYGWSKVLQLSNGNTFFAHAEGDEGIMTILYDANHKEIANKTITSSGWSKKNVADSRLCGLYEINGEAVLFFYEFIREPALFRLRISGTDGNLIKEEIIGHLDLPGIFTKKLLQAYTVGICVDKDPASDCYAVCIGSYNLNESHLIMTHYDGNHKIISEANMPSPEGYKFTAYSSAVVDGNRCAYLLVVSAKYRALDPAYKMTLGRLDAGATTFKTAGVNLQRDYFNLNSTMHYNAGTNKINLLSVAQVDRKLNALTSIETRYYETELFFIDPQTLNVSDYKTLSNKMTTAYGRSHIDKDYVFGGLPQRMIWNKDNSFTLLVEEAYENSKPAWDDAGIIELSDAGIEESGFVVRKRQETETYINLLGDERGKGRYMQDHGNPYLSFDHVKTGKAQYLIFNDLPANFDKQEDDYKRKAMSSASRSLAIYCKFEAGKMKKGYLFGGPDDNNAAYLNIAAGDNNVVTGTYATIITCANEKEKKDHIAWIKFD